ncbi:hypothetical protein ACIBHY_10720 [Nonomuraea sp. NPDC050547]|uniref:hypothetical protein n=1 Tax=Nonomuraea sp. NPDC050547 TaxID=3364368 RepID=UPI003788AC1A
MSFRRWGAALVLLLAGTASACSDPPAKITIPEPGAQARRLTLPFDAYNFSPAELMTLDVAEDLLVRDCMKSRAWSGGALPGPADSESAPPHRRRTCVRPPRSASARPAITSVPEPRKPTRPSSTRPSSPPSRPPSDERVTRAFGAWSGRQGPAA